MISSSDQSKQEEPDNIDMFLYEHTSVSDDTDDGVYREFNYQPFKSALQSFINQEIRQVLEEIEDRNNRGMFINGQEPRELRDEHRAAISATIKDIKARY